MARFTLQSKGNSGLSVDSTRLENDSPSGEPGLDERAPQRELPKG